MNIPGKTAIIGLGLCFLLASPSAIAQSGRKGEITDKPICFNIENQSPHTSFGSITTDVFTMPNGQKTRHRANFRIESKHFAEFCSSGPFFEGRKLNVQLRSLVPIFECRTALTRPLVIRGERDKDGRYKNWIDCVDQ